MIGLGREVYEGYLGLCKSMLGLRNVLFIFIFSFFEFWLESRVKCDKARREVKEGGVWVCGCGVCVGVGVVWVWVWCVGVGVVCGCGCVGVVCIHMSPYCMLDGVRQGRRDI